MDPKFQSSFIPKGPVTSSGVANLTNRDKGRSLFGFLATIFFILSLAVALGVFGYNFYLSSNISKMGNDLSTARASLDPTTINQISRLNSRIISTQTLLNQHTILSPFFDFLDASTLQSLRWTTFNYTSTTNGIQLIMQGQATGYAALSLQSNIFNKASFIKSPLFTNLALDNSGNVTFVFSATIDPSIVSYKNAVANSALSVPPTTTIVSASTTPATNTTSTTSPKSSTQVATTTKQ